MSIECIVGYTVIMAPGTKKTMFSLLTVGYSVVLTFSGGLNS